MKDKVLAFSDVVKIVEGILDVQPCELKFGLLYRILALINLVHTMP
jgi:hypothetical protein